MSRQALLYGIAKCPGCGQGVAGGLELEATGVLSLALLPFQRGQKMVLIDGERVAKPRFGQQHAQDHAQIRHPLCGHTWDVTAPLAVEDGKAVRDGKAQREVSPVQVPESLGGDVA